MFNSNTHTHINPQQVDGTQHLTFDTGSNITYMQKFLLLANTRSGNFAVYSLKTA